MSSPERVYTPIDNDLTRLPLPVFAMGADFYLRDSNFHHHFHPAITPELGYTVDGKKLPEGSAERIEGIALRQSRGQLLPTWLHRRYHSIFHGPELPADSKSKFMAVVLSCAGVVPRQAINLYTPGEFDVVNLSNKEHEFIRRRIYFEGAASKAKNDKKSNLGKFIARYVIDNSLNEILSEEEVLRRVKEFLIPRSEEARKEAGRFILEHAVNASLVDLIDVHAVAAEEGMIKRSRKRLGEIVLKYFPEHKFVDYFEPLEDRLSSMAI